ncbi:hypothetical protein ACWCW7_19815 [Nocardia tengchongensis]
MKFDDVYVRAARQWLPPGTSTCAEAVAEGALAARDEELCASSSVHVADRSCWEMAHVAASSALSDSGIEAGRVGVLTYCPISAEPEEPWSPAHRLARMLNAENASALSVFQMSNGGTAALQIAATTLATDRRTEYALATAAADFRALPFHRWAKAPGAVYGDGAQAVVLGRGHGQLRLRALSTVGDPGLEETFPTEHPFRLEPTTNRLDPGFTRNAIRIRDAVRTAVRHCLDDAELSPADPRIAAVYPTRLGERVYRQCVRPALPEPLRGRGVVLGAATGHIGGGDALANLADIVSDDGMRAGELALLVTTGAGFTASCLLVERTNGRSS